MKLKIFSLFLLSFFVVVLLSGAEDVFEKINTLSKEKMSINSSLESNNAAKATAEKNVPSALPELLSVPVVTLDKASKGAIIEGIFILQNKKNDLTRHLRRVKITLLEIDHLIKDLVLERQILSDHFYCNKANSNGTHLIDRILVDLTIFYSEILNINLIKGIYPYYLKQVQFFLDDVIHTIEQLMNENSSISFFDIKKNIEKFDNILDIIDKEEQLLKLVLETENIKLSCKKYKDRINSRHSQSAVYENSFKDKEDPFFIDQKNLIESSIKKLKKCMVTLIQELNNKQEKIKVLKQELGRHYDEYQNYAHSRPHNLEFNQTQALNVPLAIRSSKNNSLRWFVNSLEDICKKLNKNFNIQDLV